MAEGQRRELDRLRLIGGNELSERAAIGKRGGKAVGIAA